MKRERKMKRERTEVYYIISQNLHSSDIFGLESDSNKSWDNKYI